MRLIPGSGMPGLGTLKGRWNYGIEAARSATVTGAESMGDCAGRRGWTDRRRQCADAKARARPLDGFDNRSLEDRDPQPGRERQRLASDQQAQFNLSLRS